MGDLDTSGSRDATGLLHRAYVATKINYELSWNSLDWEMLQVILAAVNERRERLLTLSSADGGGYEDLLQGFAEALAERGEAPESIRTEDELSERILGRFCNRTGIVLRRKTGRKLFRDAVWLSEHPETGEKGAEKDPFFHILMQLRDEELARMPQDLAERLQTMSERGLAPKKLAERIRTLSQK